MSRGAREKIQKIFTAEGAENAENARMQRRGDTETVGRDFKKKLANDSQRFFRQESYLVV